MLQFNHVGVSDETLKKLKAVQLDSAWGILAKLGYRDNFMMGLQCLHPEMKLVGRARTLRYLPTRPDLAEAIKEQAAAKGEHHGLHLRAVAATRPGDVLIIDSGGPKAHGCWSGNIVVYGFIANGGAGFVTDGVVRDLSPMLTMEIPIYIAGSHPGGGAANVGIELDEPVRCRDVAVLPGDIILGDAEGVLVIPAAHAEQVAREAAETDHREDFYRELLVSKRFPVERIYGVRDPEVAALYEEHKKKNPVE